MATLGQNLSYRQRYFQDPGGSIFLFGTHGTKD